jgi:hypothetical protein
MLKTLLIFPLFLFSFCGFSQETKKMDSTAIFILDKMSNVIGELESCTFELVTSSDHLNEENNIVKSFANSKVSMVGPDKLITRTKNEKGTHRFFYDGSHMTYYSMDENNYVTLDAPETIMEMIDEMHVSYGFEFPGADFFYPSLTDDIIEGFDSLEFLGKKIIDGEECYHIMASNKKMNVQIWVSIDMYVLPKRFLFINKEKNNIQYEGVFKNWDLNKTIPNSVFNFLPPPKSKLISILKKS